MSINKLAAFAVAFLLSAPAVAGDARLSIAERSLRVDDQADLDFGVIVRPSAGSGDVVMTCGIGGAAVVTVPSDAVNADSGDDQCGEIVITPASSGQNIVITFGATDSDAAFTKGSDTLPTRFGLYDSQGNPVSGLGNLTFDPSASSPLNSGPINFASAASQSFYVGASASISSATATGEYTAIYEITLSSN